MTDLPELLSAIGRLEKHMCSHTKNAESQCICAYVALHSDGSGRIVFKWSHRSLITSDSSPEQRGLMNFFADIASEPEDLETCEEFDNLKELEAYLRQQRVL